MLSYLEKRASSKKERESETWPTAVSSSSDGIGDRSGALHLPPAEYRSTLPRLRYTRSHSSLPLRTSPPNRRRFSRGFTIIERNPVRLLIADDVGVSKTIEAAMMARELLNRGMIRRVGVLCDPHLCEQWIRTTSTTIERRTLTPYQGTCILR